MARSLYHVNVCALDFVTQRVVETILDAGGGAVCNMTSIHGLQGAPEHFVHTGTKAAMMSYGNTLTKSRSVGPIAGSV